MESQPQNPEFRNNPENFHPCGLLLAALQPKHMGVSSKLILKACSMSTKY